jgi:DNA-binding beta-propeller fold protein YncE
VGDVPDSASYGIFLSYRREDATPYARLLQSELTRRFPDAPVFMDLDSIEPGLDFVEVIERAVGSCAVLVVLMGRQWATLADEGGQRRLDDPDDFVRSEVQTALERGVRVIPVLVDGARPVRRQELPDELQKLARLNALELSSGRYRYDADRLFNVIQGVLAEVKERAEAERQAGEEAERVEAERKAREEAERVEAERKAARLALERLTDDDSRTVAAAAAEILGSDKPPPTPPRLELSATAVDFGRIAYRAQSPERRIRLHNAGGGSLNVRAASEAKWLKLRLEGDELALTVDTAQVGRHEHILAVDSDGGSGSVLVQVIVEPARQPPEVPVTTFPRPSPREQAVPGVQQPTGTLGGSPAPPVTAPEPASFPAWRRIWIAIAAASAVVVAGVIGYLLLAGGHKTQSAAPPSTAPPSAASQSQVLPPPCTKKSANARVLSGVPSRLVTIGGQPYDAVVSGGFGFVTYRSGLAVMDTTKFAPQVLYRIPLPTANGEALTPDHKHLVVSSGNGAVVYSVSALKHQLPAFVGQLSSPGGRYGVQVALSPDGRFAFVTLQHSGQVAVFNLRQALTRGFGPSNLVRTISVGSNPIGIAASTDGQYMYVAQGLADTSPGLGTLVILDMAKAEKKSGQPIVHTVDAGCGPARVMPSADGKYVWVTAAAGNALIAYSAAKLISDPAHALIARVALGQAPLGMMTVNNGKQIVIADSNRYNVRGAVSHLAVVDVSKALARQPALVGLIKSGTAPRQFALEPNGTTLLVTNTQSGQVQAVDISHLP